MTTPTGQDPMKEAERLIQRVEAAGYRRGLERRAPSDHEPEIAEAIAAIRKLVEAQPAAVAGEAVLVPRVPTPRMLRAMTNCWAMDPDLPENIADARLAFAEMLIAAPAAPLVGEPRCPDGWVTRTLEAIWTGQRGHKITEDMKRAAAIALRVCRGERWDDNAQDWTASPAVPAGVPTLPNSVHLPACDSSEASGSAIPARPTLPGEDALMKFYAVKTLPELVAAQAYHIEKLQAKLPPTPNVFAPQRVREG